VSGYDGAAAVKVPTYVKLKAGDVEWQIDKDWAHLVERGFLSDVDKPMEGSTVIKALKVKIHMEVQDAGEKYILKSYKESGPLKRLKAVLRGPRAMRELESCRKVMERGVPCAPILGVGVRSGSSFVVVRRLPGWDRLDHFYGVLPMGDRRRGRIAHAYGQFCRRIHDAGVHQYDLNPTNVLARWEGTAPEFLMIDFERVEFVDSVPLAVRLEALGRMDRIRAVSPPDRLRFLAGYSGGEEWREWKRMSREITRYRERSMKEQLSKVAKACVKDGRNFGTFEHGRLRGYYRKPDPETGEGGIDVATLKDLAVESGRARLGIRLKHANDAEEKWVEACTRFHEGTARYTPLAVLWIKGNRRGFIIYG
jgi:tRNA A-37 threonylcarbamoyl transferase component Bud32